MEMKVKDKVSALDNCVGIIDGTVIEIARPDDVELQRMVYNGEKRKNALTFQVVNTADGMFYHVYGSVEGRWHDWKLYYQSCLHKQLEYTLLISEHQLCLYEDGGYNQRA